MKYKAKYHHLDLEVYQEDGKWRAVAKDQFYTSNLSDKFDTAQEAKHAATGNADLHLQEFYEDLPYESLPPERVRWVEVEA
jgi:hypothetical protein